MRISFLRQHFFLSIGLLATLDGLVFFGAMHAAILIRFFGEAAPLRSEFAAIWPRAMTFSCLLLASFLSLGLYSARQRARLFGTVLRVVVAVLAGTSLTTVMFFAFPSLFVGRGVVAIAAVLSAIGACMSRVLLPKILGEDALKRRVLVYGCGRLASAITQLRRRSDRRGFIVLGFVRAKDEECQVDAAQLIDASEGLAAVTSQHAVEEIVVAMDDRRQEFPVRELLDCRLAGVHVTELLTFLERESGRVRIDAVNPSWMIFSDGFRRDPIRLLTCRVLDVAASTLLLLLTLPVMLLTIVAIKIEDGLKAPVLYRQDRVGLGGRTFCVMKFRSMRIDAERDGQAQWARDGDSRITRVGAFIRKARIDELPQLVNVLRGEMSMVGPRPERPRFVAELSESIPYYSERHCVKPGITGWAQLCYPYGSSERDALEKLQYDLYYVKNNSLLFDLAILMQTVEVVFMGKGAR